MISRNRVRLMLGDPTNGHNQGHKIKPLRFCWIRINFKIDHRGAWCAGKLVRKACEEK